MELKSSIQFSTNRIKFNTKFNNQLDLIKEQYTIVNFYNFNKEETGFFASLSKPFFEKPLSIHLQDLVNQIKTKPPESQMPSEESFTNRTKLCNL
ncbi:17679_t:CDS:1, partial [Gigaspora margarita]